MVNGMDIVHTSAILDTLKHPIRLEIIFLLSQSPATFEMLKKEIARTLYETNGNIIRGHLAVLRYYGWVMRENGIYYMPQVGQEHKLIQAIVQYVFKERQENTFEDMVSP